MMMSNQDRDESLALLRRNVGLQVRHMELLEKQKVALVACNRELFHALQQEYDGIVVEMESHENHLAKLFPFNGPKLSSLIDLWPEPIRTEALEIVAELKTLALSVKQQARENRKLIENELNFVEFELDLIMGAIRKSSHYARSGASALTTSNRLLNRVA